MCVRLRCFLAIWPVFVLIASAASAATLQSAIDAASGGVVNLQPSTTYTGGASIHSHLTVNGNGSTVALAGNDQIRVLDGATATLSGLTVSGGLGIRVFNGAASASRLVGNRLTVENPGATGIYIDDSTVSLTDSTVRGCSIGIQFYANSPGVSFNGNPLLSANNLTVEDCSNGIYMDQPPEDVSIANAVFLRNSASSILFSSAAGRKLAVGDCSFSDGGIAITMGPGTELEIASQASPGLHTVMSGLSTGVNLQASGCAASIDGLQATGCSQNAILASGVSQLSISNSSFENNRNGAGNAFCLSIRDNSANVSISQSEFRDSDRAISLTATANASLTDLTVVDCDKADGIQLLNGSDAVIARCEVSGCYSGVAANLNSRVEIDDCYLHHNIKVPGSSNTLGQGVYILDNSTGVISNTRIIGNDNEGVYCRASALTMSRCVLQGNGWVAHDGSGVFFDNTSGSIVDSKMAGNFLYGIHVGGAVSVRGCEVRGNRLGGVSFFTGHGPADQQIQSCVAVANYNPSGNWDEDFPKELESRGADTFAKAFNNLIASNVHRGVHISANATAELAGNLLLNSDGNNLDIYNGDVQASLNVLSGGTRNVYINNGDNSIARNNDILPGFSASIPAADSMECVPRPDFRENWWNDPTGPYPIGAGSYAANVRIDAFNTGPNSKYAFFEDYSLSSGATETLHADGIPFLTCEIRGAAAFDNQILAAQASRQNLFPHIAIEGAAGGYFSQGIPSGLIYMWINASYETRFESNGAVLQFYADADYLPDVEDLSALKYNYDVRQWEPLTIEWNETLGCSEASVEDIQGLYLLDPSVKSAVPYSVYSLYR
jgi:hypothetical protein